ncbi:MAG TPA: RbsD/FucU domain-containing protein [Streptosporangiaceae bacterium]|nr:RbsD/FucU domain-containing protein [Streptosporangiaceae bacterium]
MLKGIPALLNADVLYILAAMGHGDEVALVDRNFPATSMARRLARLDGTDVCTAGHAILSLFPLDTFVEEPVTRMEVVGDPSAVPDVQNDFHQLAEEAEGRVISVGSLERTAFYARTKEAFAVIATSEDRPYGCFLLTKGVV